MNREQKIQKMKRVAALGVGVALLIASIVLSNRGFGFEVSGDTALSWIGWVLALGITVIELIFNGQLAYNKNNITIYMLGIVAYVYGVGSNIIGIWAAQHLVIGGFSDFTFKSIFGALIGIFLEIAPEPLIVFGLIGISDVEGDMIGALMNTFGDKKTSVVKTTPVAGSSSSWKSPTPPRPSNPRPTLDWKSSYSGKSNNDPTYHKGIVSDKDTDEE